MSTDKQSVEEVLRDKGFVVIGTAGWLFSDCREIGVYHFNKVLTENGKISRILIIPANIFVLGDKNRGDFYHFR